jgi:antitoxin MazE
MEARIKKWGSSAAVRIPATVLAKSGLARDQPVNVREENGRIVIEAAHRKRFRIADLVEGIRPHNLHDALDAEPLLSRENR